MLNYSKINDDEAAVLGKTDAKLVQAFARNHVELYSRPQTAEEKRETVEEEKKQMFKNLDIYMGAEYNVTSAERKAIKGYQDYMRKHHGRSAEYARYEVSDIIVKNLPFADRDTPITEEHLENTDTKLVNFFSEYTHNKSKMDEELASKHGKLKRQYEENARRKREIERAHSIQVDDKMLDMMDGKGINKERNVEEKQETQQPEKKKGFLNRIRSFFTRN